MAGLAVAVGREGGGEVEGGAATHVLLMAVGQELWPAAEEVVGELSSLSQPEHTRRSR